MANFEIRKFTGAYGLDKLAVIGKDVNAVWDVAAGTVSGKGSKKFTAEIEAAVREFYAEEMGADKMAEMEAKEVTIEEVVTEGPEEKELPFFVYGTLLAGLRNYNWCLRGRTVRELPAKLQGAAMYSVGGFPAVIRADNGGVTGEVMTLAGDLYEETVKAMDNLEGYRPDDTRWSMYNRVIVTVDTAEGPVEAYTYIWNKSVEELECVSSGDWKRFEEERGELRFGGVAVDEDSDLLDDFDEEDEGEDVWEDDDEEYCGGCENELYCCTCEEEDDDECDDTSNEYHAWEGRNEEEEDEEGWVRLTEEDLKHEADNSDFEEDEEDMEAAYERDERAMERECGLA